MLSSARMNIALGSSLMLLFDGSLFRWAKGRSCVEMCNFFFSLFVFIPILRTLQTDLFSGCRILREIEVISVWWVEFVVFKIFAVFRGASDTSIMSIFFKNNRIIFIDVFNLLFFIPISMFLAAFSILCGFPSIFFHIEDFFLCAKLLLLKNCFFCPLCRSKFPR